MSAHISTALVVLILLSAHVSSYKILLIPLAGKSHIFTYANIAEGLTDRGHSVSFFVGEGFVLNDTTLKNWTKITVVRYNDSFDGVPMDHYALFDNATRILMEEQGSMFGLTLIAQK